MKPVASHYSCISTPSQYAMLLLGISARSMLRVPTKLLRSVNDTIFFTFLDTMYRNAISILLEFPFVGIVYHSLQTLLVFFRGI